MKKQKQTTNAVEILHRRYIGDDAERKASLQTERDNADIAQMIYELRQKAGLTQGELADLIGTTQSVISRLEDADYEGHSLSMLKRIAMALKVNLIVEMAGKDQESETIRYVFQELVRALRRERGLGVNEFAEKSGINRDEVLAMEHDIRYRPTPRTLFKLSKFYDIPQRQIAIIAGAIREIPNQIKQEASKFAAQSESFSKLTKEERRMLDEFVKFLKNQEVVNNGR